MNIPNALTLSRLVLSPIVFVALLFGYDKIAIAMIMYAAISDLLDGYLSRKFKQETQRGFFLDPFADKIFIDFVLIGLAIRDLFPVWLVWLVIIRDIIIGVLVYMLYDKAKKFRGKKTLMSKSITALLFIISVLPLLGIPIPSWIFYSMGLIVLIAGIEYFFQFLTFRKQKK